MPSHCGWSEVVFSLLIPKNLHISGTKWESRLVPQSNSMASGTTKEWDNLFSRSHAIGSAFWSGTGTEYAIGHLVKKSWNTTMCLLPCWVLHNINPNSFLGQYLESLGHFGELWNEPSVIQAHFKEQTYFLCVLRGRKILDCCPRSWVGVEALWSGIVSQILHFPSDEMACSWLSFKPASTRCSNAWHKNKWSICCSRVLEKTRILSICTVMKSGPSSWLSPIKTHSMCR